MRTQTVHYTARIYSRDPDAPAPEKLFREEFPLTFDDSTLDGFQKAYDKEAKDAKAKVRRAVSRYLSRRGERFSVTLVTEYKHSVSVFRGFPR